MKIFVKICQARCLYTEVKIFSISFIKCVTGLRDFQMDPRAYLQKRKNSENGTITALFPEVLREE